MSKYHVNPETGNPGKCSAKSGNCPFGSDAQHFDSIEEARADFENRQSGAFESVSKAFVPAPKPVYEMPAHKLGLAIKSIEKANRKALKAGIPERIDFEVETFEIRRKGEDGLTEVLERARLTLDKPALQHDGWTFAGTIDWDEEAGAVTRLAPGQKLEEKPRLKECDVCKTKRHRKDTYIVQKDGEQLQVGSNCLKQFMGIKPAGLFMLDFEPDVPLYLDEERLSFRGIPWNEQRRDTNEIIGLGLAVVERYGWTSRAASQYSEATADRVADILRNNPYDDDEAEEWNEIHSRALELQEETERILETVKNMEGDNEYVENLKNVSNTETVSMRNLPLLLSAIGVHERAKADAVRKKVAGKSNWVGKVGEKLENHKVVVESVKPIERQGYGYGRPIQISTLVSMRDENGNSIKWFSSTGKNFEKGEEYLLRGTVKKQDIYNDEKQTMLTRAKLEKNS